jgi:hypothetical protein
VGVLCVGAVGEKGEAGARAVVGEFAVGDSVRNVVEVAEEGEGLGFGGGGELRDA